MRRMLLFSLSSAAGLAGCSGMDLASIGDREDAAADTGFGPESPGADTDAGDGDGFASEGDDEAFAALMPAQTDVYVFIANPDRGTVTRIDVRTKDVRTTGVGLDPRIVLTTHDYATAVVFNRGDDTVTLIDADTFEQTTVPVRPNMNRMVLSPDGAWAALWHDVRAERPDDPLPSGVVSYNEVSLVEVGTGTHHPMVVGFSPRDIAWTPDGTLAVVAADAYLAKIDLTDPDPMPDLIQVAEDLVDPPVAEEVALDPFGEVAFVRQFGADTLAIVDLVTDTVTRTPIGANPTDLDLTPDGDLAVVVSRGSRELYLFDVGAPFDPPEVLPLPEDTILGSILFDPTGRRAILYTTAAPEDRYATWDLETGEVVVRSLPKPVRAMAVTPTGGSLMVFHTAEDAPDRPVGPFTGAWALSLIDLADFRPNTLLLPAEPTGFVNSASGERGYLILDGEPLLTVLDYRTLIATDVPLRSEPVWVGVLPDLDLSDGDEPVAWTSQVHPLGRLTFYDPDDGSVETLTGFELNAGIEE